MIPAAGAMEFRERRYTCQDGLSLYFRDYGDAASPLAPVVCLPGLTRNSKDFGALARRLSVSRRVLCPDYRGRGRSQYDTEWRRYHPRSYIDDVRHLMVVNNVHRAVFVGTSMGGIVAAGLAVAAPTLVAGVILNDVGPVIETDGIGKIVDYVRDTRVQPGWDAAVRHLKETFPDRPATSDSEWLAIAQATYRETDDGTLRVDWDPDLVKPLRAAGAIEIDLWPIFGALRHIPTVAIRGALSDVLSAETLTGLQSFLPSMAAITIDGVGHAPSLAEPEALLAIDELLARV
jgi:pimeloyl-ACP methyl ester carboxylesterase